MASTHLFVTVWALSSLCAIHGQRTGALRLVDGATDAQGRVEVFAQNEWGTVCDDNWGAEEAEVVCRQLGFTDIAASKFHALAHFGSGSGYIFLDNVHCTSMEDRLLDCSHNGLAVSDCGHWKDAGVTCACLDTPPCLKTPQNCPYFRTEIVQTDHHRCPVCRCASEELPDVIFELNEISTGMMLAVVIITFVIPVIAVIIVCILRHRQNKALKAKDAKAKEQQQQRQQQPDNMFA
ncbi:hypothetical protein ACOMHN_022380 [Nucella lapillus]